MKSLQPFALPLGGGRSVHPGWCGPVPSTRTNRGSQTGVHARRDLGVAGRRAGGIHRTRLVCGAPIFPPRRPGHHPTILRDESEPPAVIMRPCNCDNPNTCTRCGGRGEIIDNLAGKGQKKPVEAKESPPRDRQRPSPTGRIGHRKGGPKPK